MKANFKFILIGLCAAVSVAGGLLFLHLEDSLVLDKFTTISVKDQTVHSLQVNLSDLSPASEENYVINIQSQDLSSLNIYLKFYPDENPGNLSDFLSLDLYANDISVTKSLSEVLQNKETFALGSGVMKISLTYKMDKAVGNEAQNTFANFYIDLMAKTIASKS